MSLCHHGLRVSDVSLSRSPSYGPVLNKLPSKSVIMLPCCLGILISNHTSPIFASVYTLVTWIQHSNTSSHGTSCSDWAYCFFNCWKNSGAPRWHATISKLRKLRWGRRGNISTPSIRLWGGMLSPASNKLTNVVNEAWASRRFWRHKYGSTAREMYTPAVWGLSS